MRFGRHSHKHSPPLKLLIVVSFACLLGAALIADLLWASSSSTSSALRYVSNNWSLQQSNDKVKVNDQKKDDVPKRFIPATFADLPAPELQWEKMASAPVPRLDGAAIQIKNLLYVFAGYGNISSIHSHVDIYNFTDNTWGGRFDMPKEMAHSHLGMVTDGRYIYVVTGQYGPQCRGPTARNFVLDTETKQWEDLPSLPVPRYAPATQLWRGRLHVMGGSGVNRYTPEVDHWSLAVKDGKPLEKEWRSEIPIPRGGPHRACVVVDDRLMVIGGQEGDFMAKPGSPIFKCSRRNEIVPALQFKGRVYGNSLSVYTGVRLRTIDPSDPALEVVYADVYMLDDEMKWKNLPPMPKPDSHIEFAWAIVNNSIVIAGGTTDKHPITKRMVLNGEVFRFDLNTLKWSLIGKLPFRVKTTLVGFWDGWLYFTSGQRDRGPDDPAPRKVLGETWRTKLSF